MTLKMRSAAGRARRRGVDMMETNPRPLRTQARMRANDPWATIYNGWSTTFNAMDNSIRKVLPAK
ncbi:hypothetical protein [Corynebacterium sp. p3-SID1194]|uniref:hypothetical protein n=1 Tax=Corynebacterium sp. p3-SID1194 TaxID=2916105 RepID=UPI0021A56600|nr:hypothetical protein [Corynebacterium sp. p3-SID1194]MCT1451155.1 hypothetical protein [Corynebacterium sp. p3-SID1194]